MNEQADKKNGDSGVGTGDSIDERRVTSGESPVTNIDIEQYPLRNASDDPRWAVWTVWIWFSIALFLIFFISTLIILGLWFD